MIWRNMQNCPIHRKNIRRKYLLIQHIHLIQRNPCCTEICLNPTIQACLIWLWISGYQTRHGKDAMSQTHPQDIYPTMVQVHTDPVSHISVQVIWLTRIKATHSLSVSLASSDREWMAFLMPLRISSIFMFYLWQDYFNIVFITIIWVWLPVTRKTGTLLIPVMHTLFQINDNSVIRRMILGSTIK